MRLEPKGGVEPPT